MIAAIESVIAHEGTCLIAFHNDARPMVLHHTLEPAGRKHYLERYLAGPYLLDPHNIGRIVVNDLELMLAGLPPMEMQVAQPEIVYRLE